MVQVPSLLPDRIVAGDGASLPLRRWPPAGNIHAVVIALHGFTDYSNAFAGPGAYLAERGLAVYAYDQRGFGAAPSRGLWPGTQALVDDLREIVAVVGGAHPGKPVFLLGESMGAAAAMAAAARPPALAVDGVVLVAPAVWGWQVMHPALAGLLWLSAHLAPGIPAPITGFRALASDNIAMLEALDRDPLALNAVRIDSLYGLVDLMDDALALSGRIAVPTLVLYGAHEPFIPPAARRELWRRLPSAARGALYPEGHHTLLRDLNAPAVLDDVAAWIFERILTDRRIRGAPGGQRGPFEPACGFTNSFADARPSWSS